MLVGVVNTAVDPYEANNICTEVKNDLKIIFFY